MQWRQPLDTLLDNAAKVRILRFLCRKGGQWSGRRIAAELRLNPVTTHRALKKLSRATIVEFRRAGNSLLYSLQHEHYVVRSLLVPLFQGEVQSWQHLTVLLRQHLQPRLRGEVVAIALYGSILRGQERPTSDLDLFVLVRTAQSKRPVQEWLDQLWEPVTRAFGNSLAPYVQTVEEARQKYRRGLPLLQDILQHHQLLMGRPLRDVLNGRTT